MQPEYVVAGLGNPGREYALTRHNAGFLALDLISQKNGFEIKLSKYRSLCATAVIGGVPCLFLKPQTFMNASGEAVREALSFYHLPPERLIVIYDDVSFDPGTLRIRAKGSAGGHNGIKSILEQLGSDAFPRIKLGVGKKPSYMDLADWVLGKIPPADQKELSAALEKAADALPLLLKGELPKAMCLYN